MDLIKENRKVLSLEINGTQIPDVDKITVIAFPENGDNLWFFKIDGYDLYATGNVVLELYKIGPEKDKRNSIDSEIDDGSWIHDPDMEAQG